MAKERYSKPPVAEVVKPQPPEQPPAPLPGNCESCRFEDHGACRFGPPVPVAIFGTVQSRWPEVRPTDWCGRHEWRKAK